MAAILPPTSLTYNTMPQAPTTTQKGNRMKRSPMVCGIVFAIVGSACLPCARALDQNAAVSLCREYFASEDRTERQKLLTRLAGYEGEMDPVLQSLAKHTYQPVEPGYHDGEHFASAGFRKKHPEDLLYFVVPKNYHTDQPTGLIVFLHGGGATTSRHAPQATLRFPDNDAPRYSNRSGDMLSATGMITVGPSAPRNRQSYYRWCLRGADEYLADVILECKSRFNIDPNRVFLLGHSMGGFARTTMPYGNPTVSRPLSSTPVPGRSAIGQ